MKVKSNDKGVCPYCNHRSLEYDVIELQGEMQYFPWHCGNCGAIGEEWYSLEFIGHNIIDENGENIEITDDMIGDEEDER